MKPLNLDICPDCKTKHILIDIELTESVKRYFRTIYWKQLAKRTKLGDKDYINPKSYDVAIKHYRSIIIRKVTSKFL